MKTFKYKSNDELINFAIELLCQESQEIKGEYFCDPSNVHKYLVLNHKQEPSETFSVMFLTSKNELISFETLFRGSINSAQVYPRTIAQAALRHNAAATILCHHHPSKNVEPSQSDLDLTKRLIECMRLIDVKVLDHFILGGNKYHSMAENNLI